MTDPNVVDGALHMLAIGGPGQGHVVHQFAKLLLACAGAGLREALQHALVGDGYDAGIDCMVSVVVAVFLSIKAKNVVKTKFAAQHGS